MKGGVFFESRTLAV